MTDLRQPNRAELASMPKPNLTRNTFWMTLGQGSRALIQAFYFTFIARALGVTNYGAFVGVVALVGIVSPFASGGRGNLLVKHVSRNPASFPTMWGTVILTTLVAGSLAVALVTSLSSWVLPKGIPGTLIFLVGMSDIVGMNLITAAGQAFQAHDRLGLTAALSTSISASRLLAIAALYLYDQSPSSLQWSIAYFLSTTLIALVACSLVWKLLGRPILSFPRSGAELREGFYFSASLSAQTIYNDIDKTMLTRLGSFAATGVYGAAYRLIDVSFAPVSALLYAAYPHFFRKGSLGLAPGLLYARPLLLRSLTYASLVAFAILLFAGVVPHVLGEQYADVAEALRWLAPLPLFKAIHYFLSDAFSGAGYQALRCLLQFGVAIFNILINLWLIPAYSWRGAAWSSLASDALLAAGVSISAFYLMRLERRPASEEAYLQA